MPLRLNPPFSIFALACAVILSSCATPSELSSLDLSQPGWQTWEGQSVWENRFSKDPVIGEFVSGVSETQGIRFAELSKGGVPVIRARRTSEKWEIQFLPMNIAQRGSGDKPSPKWIFLTLPDILSGGAPPPGWEVERTKDRVILTNAKLKERLELLIQG